MTKTVLFFRRKNYLLIIILIIPLLSLSKSNHFKESLKFPGTFISIETDGWQPKMLKHYTLKKYNLKASYKIDSLELSEESEVYINLIGKFRSKKDNTCNSGSIFKTIFSVYELKLTNDQGKVITLRKDVEKYNRKINSNGLYKPFIIKLPAGKYLIELTSHNENLLNHLIIRKNYLLADILLAKAPKEKKNTFISNPSFNINQQLKSSKPLINYTTTDTQQWFPPVEGYFNGPYHGWTGFDTDTLVYYSSLNYTKINLSLNSDSTLFDLFLVKKNGNNLEYLPIVLRASYFKAEIKDLPEGKYQFRHFVDIGFIPMNKIKTKKSLVYYHYYPSTIIFLILFVTIILLLIFWIAIDVNRKTPFYLTIVKYINNKKGLTKFLLLGSKVLEIVSFIFIGLLFVDELLLFFKEHNLHIHFFVLNYIVELLNNVYIQVIILLFIYILLFVYLFEIIRKHLNETSKNLWICLSFFILLISFFMSTLLPITLWYSYFIYDSYFLLTFYYLSLVLIIISLILFFRQLKIFEKEIRFRKLWQTYSHINLFMFFMVLTEHIITRVLLLLGLISMMRKVLKGNNDSNDISNSSFFRKNHFSFKELIFFNSGFIIIIGFMILWRPFASPFPPADSFYLKPITISLLFSIPIVLYVLGMVYDLYKKTIYWVISIFFSINSFFVFPVIFPSIFEYNLQGKFPEFYYSHEFRFLLLFIGIEIFFTIVIMSLNQAIHNKSLYNSIKLYSRLLSIKFILLSGTFLFMVYYIYRPYTFQLISQISSNYNFILINPGIKVWFLEMIVLGILVITSVTTLTNKDAEKIILKKIKDKPDIIITDKNIIKGLFFNISVLKNTENERFLFKKKYNWKAILLIAFILINAIVIVQLKRNHLKLIWVQHEDGMWTSPVSTYSDTVTNTDYYLSSNFDTKSGNYIFSLYDNSNGNLLKIRTDDCCDQNTKPAFLVKGDSLFLFTNPFRFGRLLIYNIKTNKLIFKKDNVLTGILNNQFLLYKKEGEFGLLDLKNHFVEKSILKHSQFFEDEDYYRGNIFKNNEIIAIPINSALFVYNIIKNKGSIIKINGLSYYNLNPIDSCEFYIKQKFKDSILFSKYRVSEKGLKKQRLYKITKIQKEISVEHLFNHYSLIKKKNTPMFILDLKNGNKYNYSKILNDFDPSRESLIINKTFIALASANGNLIIDNGNVIKSFNLSLFEKSGRIKMLYKSNKILAYNNNNLYIIEPKKLEITKHYHFKNCINLQYDPKKEHLLGTGRNIFEYDILQNKITCTYEDHLGFLKHENNLKDSYLSISIADNTIFATDIYSNVFCFIRN